jgi:hypothetical protein
MQEAFVPNPGSEEAIALGCRCPVLDNGHGRGWNVDAQGKSVFVFNIECPPHGDSGSEIENRQHATE